MEARHGLQRRTRVARIGLVLGPLLALATYLALPDRYVGSDGELVAFSHAGRATAAVAVWMAAWWFTEAIAIYATALLPLVVFPLAGIASTGEAAAPYAHELIFLFMGGFLIALTMERWGLHKRIALRVLRMVGNRPSHMVGGFMAVAGALSMWVSNTATAVMMLPVAISVVELIDRRTDANEPPGQGATPVDDPVDRLADAPKQDEPSNPLAVALLLGVAYGASIGGIATPIGTPPNLFLISFVESELGREISFVRWMTIALPLVLLFLPLTWWLLTRVLQPVSREPIEGSRRLVRRELEALGTAGRGERITFVVFLLACALWLTRPLLSELDFGGTRPLAGLSDAGIAMLAALILFVAPVDRRRFALDWPTAVRLPWGILILFGGGLSLAAAIRTNGVGEWIGAQTGALAGLPMLAILIGVIAGMVFLTELTSNTASTAALVPILAALAPGLGVDPLLLIVPAAIAASCAFMLPVATPPNAVVFGSERIELREMVRAGLWLNFVGIALITLITYAVVIPLLIAG